MVFGVNVPHSESSITVCMFCVLSIHVVVYAALCAVKAPSVLYAVCFGELDDGNAGVVIVCRRMVSS